MNLNYNTCFLLIHLHPIISMKVFSYDLPGSYLIQSSFHGHLTLEVIYVLR